MSFSLCEGIEIFCIQALACSVQNLVPYTSPVCELNRYFKWDYTKDGRVPQQTYPAYKMDRFILQSKKAPVFLTILNGQPTKNQGI